MEKLLKWREEELKFLQAERRRVDSLLKQCEKVKHLVRGTAFSVC